jgi:hypothetical protein
MKKRHYCKARLFNAAGNPINSIEFKSGSARFGEGLRLYLEATAYKKLNAQEGDVVELEFTTEDVDLKLYEFTLGVNDHGNITTRTAIARSDLEGAQLEARLLLRGVGFLSPEMGVSVMLTSYREIEDTGQQHGLCEDSELLN